MLNFGSSVISEYVQYYVFISINLRCIHRCAEAHLDDARSHLVLANVTFISSRLVVGGGVPGQLRVDFGILIFYLVFPELPAILLGF